MGAQRRGEGSGERQEGSVGPGCNFPQKSGSVLLRRRYLRRGLREVGVRLAGEWKQSVQAGNVPGVSEEPVSLELSAGKSSRNGQKRGPWVLL